MTRNHEVLLASYPEGMPETSHFIHQHCDMPGGGGVTLRLIWLSVDPYLRGRMAPVKSYIPPFEPGKRIESHCVAEVTASDNPAFAAGDVVTGTLPWAEHQSHSGEGLTKITSGAPLSYHLGVLGMPGMTAWAGLNIHGKPKEGETLVVSAASGAVGSLAVQLGKKKGLRVVGVAGGPEKCAFVKDELGADDCLDHRDPALAEQMAAACPDGIDIYFENVGGVTLDAVLPLLNQFARIPLCGVIAHYRLGMAPQGTDRLVFLWRRLLTTRSTVRGFIVFDHWDRYPEFLEEVTPLVLDGTIKARESVHEGLETAPAAFVSLLDGGNFGKQVVRVGPDP